MKNIINKLTVHLQQTKTQKIGTLATKDNKIYFEYDKELLKSSIEISPLDRFALVGKDGMGALEYEPASEFKSVVDEIILDDLAKGSKNILKGNSEDMIDELFALGGIGWG